MSENNNKGGGIGFVGLLTLIFITLKLCDAIQWGWIWVLAPIWISFIIFLLMLAIFFVFYILESK